MTGLIGLYDGLARFADRQADWLLPTAARLVFAAVLFSYFWTSAGTKLDGFFTPSLGAYAQIFPKAFETAGYDPSAMSFWQSLVALAGAWAEYLLPLLIVFGLFTRLAAIGMVGFVLVQSLTDILGHGAGPETVGAWFDAASDALILDQRAFWMFLFLVLIVKGAGPISADRFLGLAKARHPA
jgi:putative oxidoreductase